MGQAVARRIIRFVGEKSKRGSRARLNRADMSHMSKVLLARSNAAAGGVVAALVLAGCGPSASPPEGPAAVLNTAIDLRIDEPGTDPINAWCQRYPRVGGAWCNMAGVND